MTLPDRKHVELAVPGDVERLYRLRRQLEDWLQSKGVRQWPPGEVSRAILAEQVGRHEWHLVRHPDIGVAAAMRLLSSDPDIWGQDGTAAVYVHGLMVDRALAGTGMGPSMLDRAAAIGRSRGADVCRLDCVEHNGALRSFYAGQGFREVGRRDVSGLFGMTLFEKLI